MCSRLVKCLIVISIMFNVVDSAKILAIFPFSGRSQYIAVERYLTTLAARGHEMTVITQYPQKTPLKNFHDIKITYEGYEENVMMIMNAEDDSEMIPFILSYSYDISVTILEHPEMQEILKDSKTHFDLIIVETAFSDALYGLGPHFNAHLMGFSSYGTDPLYDTLVGNKSPLSYIPSVMGRYTREMDFWQRLQNVCGFFLQYLLMERPILKMQTPLYEKYFPHLRHLPLEEVRKNFSLMLLNQHFSLSLPRPYVPNMIEVGGMHIDYKPKPLPKPIQDFIDGAENGVIYFSLGSNVKGKYLTAETRAVFLKIFGSLKERILWKFEETTMEGKPENVFISEWFPQADILAHPKVKLFITHSGLLSTMEAVFHAKPILGMPIFFDQFYNLDLAVTAGYGLGVDFKNINDKNLRESIRDILGNPKYTKAAQQVSARFHDQPMKPLDVAIYWTEYILRHNGAEHMRVAGRKLNFFQFYCLDCIAFILSIIILLISLVVYSFIFIKNCFITETTEKVQKNLLKKISKKVD